jgi:hypothetical protein
MNRYAGQEPKGAISLLVFLVLASTEIQPGMPDSRTVNNTIRKKIMERLRQNRSKSMSTKAGNSGSAGGAFALPVPRRGWRFLWLPR